MIDIELAYMNTNHPDFIGFDRYAGSTVAQWVVTPMSTISLALVARVTICIHLNMAAIVNATVPILLPSSTLPPL